VHVGEEEGATVVAVEDAGAGVPDAVRGRAGEPFLTTKEPGKGMGLGLYFVRSLVEQVGGRLEMATRSPHGTRVALRLGRSGA
jgi:two-component system sensor histidine kinase RegB